MNRQQQSQEPEFNRRFFWDINLIMFNDFVYKWLALYIIRLVEEAIFTNQTASDTFMLNYRNLCTENYKCRICSAHFQNPEELRIHRMVSHKGHMLTIKR